MAKYPQHRRMAPAAGAPQPSPLDVFEIKLKTELDYIGRDIGREFLEFNKLLTQSQNLIVALARFVRIPPKKFAEMMNDTSANKSFEASVVAEFKRSL